MMSGSLAFCIFSCLVVYELSNYYKILILEVVLTSKACLFKERRVKRREECPEREEWKEGRGEEIYLFCLLGKKGKKLNEKMLNSDLLFQDMQG